MQTGNHDEAPAIRLMPLVLVAVAFFGVLLAGSWRSNAGAEAVRELKSRYSKKHTASVDHSKFPVLERKFNSPLEVTPACISCHTERHKEVMASTHWNWSREVYIPGRGIRSIGKKNVINNFCIGVSSNLEGCDKCHAGYGFVDAKFDFNDPKHVDCLACHDGSNTYIKTGRGMPAPSVNLNLVARKVGRPQRANCGACHFDGGGGNNVKHGDLEQALVSATREVDVHMGTDGADLECVDCHTTRKHRMLGKLYSVSSANRDRSTCEQCHGNQPHSDGILNEHMAKVACQTCHVPAYAKVNATKMRWDWSTAGRLRDGEPYELKNKAGDLTYASIKGSFSWARNVKPDYIWFNGTADHYLLGDKLPAARPVPVNVLHGDFRDPESKIVPVKIHHARQIFDPANNMLIQPKLVGARKGEGAFWKDFDWNRAAEEGMKTSGLPYSGRYDFIDTTMTWPVNHMVSPKEKAVACVECHTRANSRLRNLAGFYMPGRDGSGWVDWLGMLAVAGTLAGVLVHAGLRIFTRRRMEA